MPKAAEPAKPKKTTTPRPKRARPRAAGKTDHEIRLTGDRLVVRVPDESERRSSGGLLIPATAAPAPRRLIWADVTQVGPDVRVAGRGDRVLFLPSSGLEVELDGDELILLRERDVQAVATAPARSRKDRAPGQYL